MFTQHDKLELQHCGWWHLPASVVVIYMYCISFKTHSKKVSLMSPSESLWWMY